MNLSPTTDPWADGPDTISLQRVCASPDGTRSYCAEGSATVTLRDGSSQTVDHDTPEDADGNHYGLDADTHRAAMWWYGPNLAAPFPFPAEKRLVANVDNGLDRAHGATTGQKQRVGAGPSTGIGGNTWELQIEGLSIPPSADPNYLPGQASRKVFVAYYLENQR